MQIRHPLPEWLTTIHIIHHNTLHHGNGSRSLGNWFFSIDSVGFPWPHGGMALVQKISELPCDGRQRAASRSSFLFRSWLSLWLSLWLWYDYDNYDIYNGETSLVYWGFVGPDDPWSYPLGSNFSCVAVRKKLATMAAWLRQLLQAPQWSFLMHCKSNGTRLRTRASGMFVWFLRRRIWVVSVGRTNQDQSLKVSGHRFCG